MLGSRGAARVLRLRIGVTDEDRVGGLIGLLLGLALECCSSKEESPLRHG